MKNKLMPLVDKWLLRKRAIVETVFDQLKNISQIEHSRHRSINNFMVNWVGGLAAYILQPKKPSLNLQPALLINDWFYEQDRFPPSREWQASVMSNSRSFRC